LATDKEITPHLVGYRSQICTIQGIMSSNGRSDTTVSSVHEGGIVPYKDALIRLDPVYPSLSLFPRIHTGLAI